MENRAFTTFGKENVSVSFFKEVIASLFRKFEPEHKDFFVNVDIELDNATTLGSIWYGLCISWNCFNPSLLGHIIERLDDEMLKTDMEDYKKKLKCFKTKTQLNDTVEVTFQKSSEETFMLLAVNLNEA